MNVSRKGAKISNTGPKEAARNPDPVKSDPKNTDLSRILINWTSWRLLFGFREARASSISQTLSYVR